MSQDSADATFDAFVRRRYAVLLRSAYLMIGDRDVAADLVHDALLATLPRWADLRDVGAAEGYVRRSMITLTISAARRERAYRGIVARAYAGSAPGDGDEIESRLDVWAEVLRLPPRQRAAIVLRYYDDLSVEDAAAALDCSVTTLKTHLKRGRARLARALQPHVVIRPEPWTVRD